MINPTTPLFDALSKTVPIDRIASIRIIHHWSYDELYVKSTDGSESRLAFENEKVQVWYDGRIRTFALCKLDYILLGKTIVL